MVTTVNCPTCEAKVVWREENKFRPFCSERCKQIDLGAWAEDFFAGLAAAFFTAFFGVGLALGDFLGLVAM